MELEAARPADPRARPVERILVAPGAELEEALMAGGPGELLPFADQDDPRLEHQRPAGAIHKGTAAAVDASVDGAQQRAEELGVGPLLDATFEHERLDPAALKRSLERHNRRVVLC